jgi:broad specificity phosphatase PhoE
MARYLELRRHTMRNKPGDHVNQAGVDRARRVGFEMGSFDQVITSSLPRAFETAIAMGFAVDEQNPEFSFIPDDAMAEVNWEEGFPAWSRALRLNGLAGHYVRKQGRLLREIVAALPGGGAALVVSHGGILEAGAVGCAPEGDHDAWGTHCDYCEGICLTFEAGVVIDAKVLRLSL